MVVIDHGPSTPWNAYIATLLQAGTAAPVPTIIQNEIGGIVWTYSAVGVYIGTLANAFPTGKTLVGVTLGVASALTFGAVVAANTITLSFFDAAGAAAELAGTAFVEIRIFG